MKINQASVKISLFLFETKILLLVWHSPALFPLNHLCKSTIEKPEKCNAYFPNSSVTETWEKTPLLARKTKILCPGLPIQSSMHDIPWKSPRGSLENQTGPECSSHTSLWYLAFSSHPVLPQPAEFFSQMQMWSGRALAPPLVLFRILQWHPSTCKLES